MWSRDKEGVGKAERENETQRDTVRRGLCCRAATCGSRNHFRDSPRFPYYSSATPLGEDTPSVRVR
jgi:hypothetical protein